MEILKLETTIRTDSGKGFTRKLRSTGRIPAILYGQKHDAISLEIDEAEVRTVLHQTSEGAIIDLVVKGDESGEPVNVIVRDVQRHPATGRLLHIDFQRIKYGEKIRVEIKVVLIGVPAGVKEQGGILEHGMRLLQMNCLPSKIPEAIEIDVSELMIGDAIKLKEIDESYPDFDFLDDAESTMAGVIPPIVEAKPAEEEEVEAAEGEPELVEKEGEKGPEDAAESKES
jgi:large subunit ribosomal protein L25